MSLSSLVEINERLVFAIILIAWIIYRVARILTRRKLNLPREILLNLAFLYGCLVFKVTFFPMAIVLYAFDPYESNLVPLVRSIQMIQYGSFFSAVRNLAGNFILLAPLGFFLTVFFQSLRRAWKILGVGFLVSLSIELLQLLLKVRIFDVDDLIFNTLGVLIGYGIFLLLIKIPPLSRRAEKIAPHTASGGVKAFAAFGAVALLSFLSIYSTQVARQTQTEPDIIRALPAAQQTYLGSPKFGDFMFLFSQSSQGEKSFAIYRKVFFNRYTLFEWGDLLLNPETYRVSGMSTGNRMNFFIIARTQKNPASLASEESRFPLEKIGDYDFSVASLPLDEPDRFSSFRFLDSQGNDLVLASAQ